MTILAGVFAGVAAVLHVVFWVFESILWTQPKVYGRFGIASAEQAETIRPMAYNQGFYNLALAVGVVVGIVLLGGEGSTDVVGRTLIAFGTACMVTAGVVLATTGKAYRRAALIQAVPAFLALVFVVAA